VQTAPSDTLIVAPLPRRVAAYMVDVLVLVPFVVGAAASHGWSIGAYLLLLVAVQIVNQVVLVARTGQSIGKRLTGLRIVGFTNHRTPSGVQAFARWFVVSIAIGIAWRPGWLVGGWSITIGPWQLLCYGLVLLDPTTRRGLHDRIAGTIVVDARAIDVPGPI
jgi:uncharacterized RDD family membrane protein YckC